MFEIRPVDYFAPLQLSHYFPDDRPLEVDLGCGEGLFLVEMARRHPERNFLGIERQFHRVKKVCDRARRTGVKNLRALRLESEFFLRQMLPPRSASRIYLLFADPWPKKRHHDRRVVQQPFLAACARGLKEDGALVVKTDHTEYFEHICAELEIAPEFLVQSSENLEVLPQTDFERRFLRQSKPINQIWAKLNPDRLPKTASFSIDSGGCSP